MTEYALFLWLMPKCYNATISVHKLQAKFKNNIFIKAFAIDPFSIRQTIKLRKFIGIAEEKRESFT